MRTTIYLVRHAQSQPLPTVVEEEWSLSPHGKEQAAAIVPVLTLLGAQRIYTSPYRRCCETLRPFAEAAGLELVRHDGLRERCFGRQWIGDFRDVWRKSWQDFAYAVPGGETSWACRARIATAVETLARRNTGETLVLGSHGNAIALLLNFIDPSFGMLGASTLRTPELLKVVFDGERLEWERAFAAGDAFESIATDFRLTPGIVA